MHVRQTKRIMNWIFGHLLWQIHIAKINFPKNHVLMSWNHAFSLTKKTIPSWSVTFIWFFGHTKRMPRFQHKSLFAVRLLFWNQLRFFCLENPSFSHMALGALPWNSKFLRHRNTGKAEEKARYFAGFPVYSTPDIPPQVVLPQSLILPPRGNNTIMPLIWDVKVLIEQYPSSCQTKCTLCFCQTKCTTLFFTPCVYFEKWQSAFLPHIF